jgi:unsaturated chondroitin disaccharide hydrolase
VAGRIKGSPWILVVPDFAALAAAIPPPAGSRYRTAAVNILTSLSTPGYLAQRTIFHSTLLHATGARIRNIEVDVGLIYGDYHFIEALLRKKKLGL